LNTYSNVGGKCSANFGINSEIGPACSGKDLSDLEDNGDTDFALVGFVLANKSLEKGAIGSANSNAYSVVGSARFGKSRGITIQRRDKNKMVGSVAIITMATALSDFLLKLSRKRLI
jgi:hypothetical protein